MPDKPALYGCGSVQADAGGAAVPPGSFFADFPGFGVMGPLEKHRQEAHQTTEVVAFRGGRGCKSMCSLVSMLSIRSEVLFPGQHGLKALHNGPGPVRGSLEKLVGNQGKDLGRHHIGVRDPPAPRRRCGGGHGSRRY